MEDQCNIFIMGPVHSPNGGASGIGVRN